MKKTLCLKSMMSNLPPKRSSNFESSPSLSLEFEAALTTAAAAAAGLESEDAPFDFFDRLKSSSEFESLQRRILPREFYF